MKKIFLALSLLTLLPTFAGTAPSRLTAEQQEALLLFSMVTDKQSPISDEIRKAKAQELREKKLVELLGTKQQNDLRIEEIRLGLRKAAPITFSTTPASANNDC